MASEQPVREAKEVAKKPDESGLSIRSAIQSTILVQKLFRGFKDRHKYRRRVLLAAWDELEHKEESELHLSSRELGKLTEMYSKLHIEATPTGGRRPSFVVEREKLKEVKSSEFKPTLSWLAGFMDKTSKEYIDGTGEKKAPMAVEDLTALLDQAKASLKQLPNVVRVELKSPVKLTVVGDLHGQVKDLLFILKKHGLPTKDKWFLFNGDFVDRGKHSCETCIILFALKLLFPSYVYLNRGNHEADDINARDGFQDEVFLKYSQNMYDKFNDTFTALPLVHIINNTAMVVHGGLCWDAGVTIDSIGKIDRFCLHPEWESVMEDLLWSDPGGPKHNGASQNDRGCGCIFGEDIVDEFFEDNPPLNLVIRSHEKKEWGFEEHFHGKLLTVFSASNYCGDNGNHGAVLEVAPKPNGTLGYTVHKFYTTMGTEEEKKSFADQYCTLSASVAAKLIHRIATHRLELLDYYAKCVQSAKGRLSEPGSVEVKNNEAIITRVEWARGLTEVLGLKISFLFLQSLLGVPMKGIDGKNKGKFNYVEWLAKFAPTTAKLKFEAKGSAPEVQQTLLKIVNVLQKHRVAVKTMFRFFDLNGDGVISPQELANGLVCLGKVYEESFEVDEVKTLVAHLDKDKSNSIDYSEFLNTFTVSNPELSQALKSVKREDVMRGGTVSSAVNKPKRAHRMASRQQSLVIGKNEERI
mmetsp:Transcript_32754/g.63923  ORF Transcript_32754/g.63923 Transcript_32754/m.63923 type:complete len:695 (-) Transcript_32754:191-2275(-)